MTKIDLDVALEVCTHEGLVQDGYFDSEGVLTWSVGITSASGHAVERYKNNPQSIRKCLEVYLWLLERSYAPAVRRAFQGYRLKKHEFAAALSFHWNTGGISRATWVRQVKAGEVSAARVSFMQWNKPSSIVERRRKERNLFFDGTWSKDGKINLYKTTSSHRIIWSSIQRVDIGDVLAEILGGVSTEPAPGPAPDPGGAGQATRQEFDNMSDEDVEDFLTQ